MNMVTVGTLVSDIYWTTDGVTREQVERAVSVYMDDLGYAQDAREVSEEDATHIRAVWRQNLPEGATVTEPVPPQTQGPATDATL